MKNIIISVFVIIMFFAGMFLIQDICLAANGITAPTGTGLPTGSIAGSIGKIIKTIAGVIGGLSILMIVIGGIMYISSGGDSSKAESAKNTVLYAVIGLIIALTAWIVVNTVITNLDGGGGGGGPVVQHGGHGEVTGL